MAIANDRKTNDLATAPTTRAPKEIRVVHDDGPLAHLMDSARFEHLQRIALLMATASLIPNHLRGESPQETLGNCFLVVNQALRWGLDPFAVAAETYSVQGKLGFQGKLIAALVNARANIVGKLRYEFKGKGDERTVTVIGRFEDEDQERTVDLSVGQAKTSNKMWQTDADQKLIYSAATKWARRHCPEVLLGVLIDDDLEHIEENRSIANGPTTRAELTTLADVTRKLTERVDEHGEIHEVETVERKEPEAQAETGTTGQQSEADPYEDLINTLDMQLQSALERKSTIEANNFCDKALERDLPQEIADRIAKMRQDTVKAIKAGRGEGSNAK